ncbi:hypothetical protein Pcinc_002124 [Petrolisthes cinctipes]|uniref:Mutator-like transposase domain-containing protein n=1 Tax=Petrolisthes cinctipes TaxID=88211 RepID=A0AAE1GLK7_PETCI|nr:hypothetical protein Pcinc_002124 [Petrolisthes cinctipes]
MKIKEESAVGMAKTYVAICGQCNIEQQMCTSQGGVKKSCRYDLHKRLVRGALHSGGYTAVRELCATLNMHPLSEKSYHQIGKEIQEKGIEEMERVMEKSPVKRLAIYDVEKQECVNHVSKRLGTALLQAKKVGKLGGRKKGALTQDKVMRLAHYFGKAIKQDTTVEDMKKEIFATLRHCQSTDAKPQHSTCPDGKSSWCFYKRSVARNVPIPSHNKKMKTFLTEKVVSKILPIYMKVATNELLDKCKGDTQNANECLHSSLWSELPKTKFFSLQRMTYSLYRSVVRFNHGSTAMAMVEGETGKEILEIRKRMDRK